MWRERTFYDLCFGFDMFHPRLLLILIIAPSHNPTIPSLTLLQHNINNIPFLVPDDLAIAADHGQVGRFFCCVIVGGVGGFEFGGGGEGFGEGEGGEEAECFVADEKARSALIPLFLRSKAQYLSILTSGTLSSSYPTPLAESSAPASSAHASPCCATASGHWEWVWHRERRSGLCGVGGGWPCLRFGRLLNEWCGCFCGGRWVLMGWKNGRVCL